VNQVATSPSTISSGLETSGGLTLESLFSKNQKQLDAWNAQSEKRFLLYGGAAGGGKSFFLRWWAVGYLIWLYEQGIPCAQVGLFCEDYPSLRDRQISKIEMEFPPSLGRLRQGDTREFELGRQFGSGKILLRNLDDPSKYLSAEFAGIAVDELTRNELGMFDFLRSRLRWPGVQRPRFVGATNPGGKGHAWVKKYWIDRQFPPELGRLADEFVFVPAKAADNPYLTESYFEELKTLPADMAKAYAEGSWDQFKGQYFTNFTPERHIGRRQGSEIVCKADGKVYVVDYWWPKWFSLDWGFNHEFAAYWHTTAPDGRHITYREWVANGLTPRMLAQGILERSIDAKGAAEKIAQFFLSPDAFADRTGQSTIAEQIREVTGTGNRFPMPAQASDDRVGGWQLLYSLLENDQWLIAENCERLINNLPSLIHDEKKTEDVMKVDGDDPADSARYGLYSRLGETKAPKEVRAAERVAEVTDPTARAMILERFFEEEARKDKPIPVGRRHGVRKKFGF
jgi:phage terminase large subunit